jgi:hypothetical protein
MLLRSSLVVKIFFLFSLLLSELCFSNLSANAQSLKPQLEASIYIDESWNQLLGASGSSLVQSTLAHAQLVLSKATGFELVNSGSVIKIPQDLTAKNSGDEMLLFKKQIEKLGTSEQSDLHILFTTPRQYSWAFGLSYQDSLCSDQLKNLIIIRMNSPIFSALTLVHEIGHMFGAKHTSDNKPDLMSALFSLPWPDSFNSESINAIKALVNKNGACLLESQNQETQLSVTQLSQNKVVLSWPKLKRTKKLCRLSSFQVPDQGALFAKQLSKNQIDSRMNSKVYRIPYKRITGSFNVIWSLKCPGQPEYRSARVGF